MNTSKLYVGNLNYATTEDELRETFSKHGTVKEITIIPNKGFGFVEMSNAAEAEAAKTALNQTVLGGRTINVDEARPPKEKFKKDFRRY